ASDNDRARHRAGGHATSVRRSGKGVMSETIPWGYWLLGAWVLAAVLFAWAFHRLMRLGQSDRERRARRGERPLPGYGYEGEAADPERWEAPTTRMHTGPAG